MQQNKIIPVAHSETKINLLISANLFLFKVMVLKDINFQEFFSEITD